MTTEEMVQRIIELEALVEQLVQDSVFEIVTRQGLILKTEQINSGHVIFLDVDFMHQQNEKHGYDVVNEKIKLAFRSIRSSDGIVKARWFSGDEFVVIVQVNPEGVMHRLIDSFRQQGLTITCSYSKFEGDLEHAVRRASTYVQDAKRNNLRDQAIISEHERNS